MVGNGLEEFEDLDLVLEDGFCSLLVGGDSFVQDVDQSLDPVDCYKLRIQISTCECSYFYKMKRSSATICILRAFSVF